MATIKIQKTIWFEPKTLDELKKRAAALDVPVNSYIKMKIFGGQELE